MPRDKTIGGSYRFTYANYGTPESYPDYRAHSNQMVTIVRKLKPNESPNVMYEVKAEDGWTGNALGEELRKMSARQLVGRALKATHTFTFDKGGHVRGIPVKTTDTGQLLFITLHTGGKVGRIWQLNSTDYAFINPIRQLERSPFKVGDRVHPVDEPHLTFTVMAVIRKKLGNGTAWYFRHNESPIEYLALRWRLHAPNADDHYPYLNDKSHGN